MSKEKLSNEALNPPLRKGVVSGSDSYCQHDFVIKFGVYITPPKNPQIFSLWDERWF